MKKFFYSIITLAMATTGLISCEDVPAPYSINLEETKNSSTTDAKGELNTAETPWTVAEAVKKIQAKQTTNGEAYVKGIISEVVSYNDKFKSITYYISDNGTDKTLQIYSGKGLNGAAFSAKTDLQVGQTVIVKGNLKAFTNKKGEVIMEVDKENKIISISETTNAQPAVTGLTAKFETGMDQFTITDLKLPSELTFVWKHDAKSKYMKASAFKKPNNYAAESRLVSPAFSLAGKTKATLSFKHAVNFLTNAANNFKVQVSTDGKTWTDLAVSAYPTGNDWKFIDATCDLSAYAGKSNLHIGFLYTSTQDKAGTWEIKDVEVK